MNKTDSIARRILGWKLNRWDRWFDYEKGVFIYDFHPEQKLSHAMMIVERLEELGFEFKSAGDSEVWFNDVRATGETLAEAITNAAYTIIENTSIVNTANLWRRLC